MREILTSPITWTAVITAAVTLIFNVVFHVLKNQYDWLVDKRKLKRESANKQLEKLYLEINSIILQFEFVKKFNEKHVEDNNMSDRELFSHINIDKVNVRYYKPTKEIILDDEMLSQIRIIQNEHLELIDKIILMSEYASPELLNLAVSYRYCENNYLYAKGNENRKDKIKWENIFKEEMDHILNEIIHCIKKDIRVLLKLCGMEFKQEKKENEDAE